VGGGGGEERGGEGRVLEVGEKRNEKRSDKNPNEFLLLTSSSSTVGIGSFRTEAGRLNVE